jgi:uncharacterized membrane protein YgcG
MALMESIAALVAKVASASTVAQATAGLGIAVAGVTGAGAAGVLPATVQDTVAGAVEAVTPFAMPHATADHVSVVRHTPGDDNRQDDGPAVVPTTAVVTPAPVAPTAEPAEQEAEHGTETADATHQHRGGRSSAPVATADSPDDSPHAAEAPEVGDDHGGDSSGHGGGGNDTSGSSGGSGHDDGSGHGGDD